MWSSNPSNSGNPFKLLRYQKFIAVILPGLSLYIYYCVTTLDSFGSYFSMIADCLLNVVPLVPPSRAVERQQIVRYLSPLIVVGLLALYAFVSISYLVIMFNDCPEAAKELEREIKEAKAELKRLGVSIR